MNKNLVIATLLVSIGLVVGLVVGSGTTESMLTDYNQTTLEFGHIEQRGNDTYLILVDEGRGISLSFGYGFGDNENQSAYSDYTYTYNYLTDELVILDNRGENVNDDQY